MADESKLKAAYRHIETDAAEMRRYRAKLASKLTDLEPTRTWHRFLWLAVPIAAVLILAIFRGDPKPVFSGDSPQEIRALLATNPQPEALLALAEKAHRYGQAEERLNATMALCLLRPVKSGVYLAADGLRQDQRPAFRTFYLEYLLDHADDFQVNEAEVENLMDEETDALCLALYEDLLKIS